MSLYQNVFKPFLFKFDAEAVHNVITFAGETVGDKIDFSYTNKKLHQKICGLDFANPMGLAAGFDYDGHLVTTMKSVGFGFNTVGTVTAKPYEGNKPPRLGRLPNSKALLVNKGFKSEGVDKVIKRLDQKKINSVVGISVGSSNLPEVNTVSKAIDDYLETFSKLKTKDYISYFELNISCPNTLLDEPFTHLENLENLLKEVRALKIRQPIFIKMKNEITTEKLDGLIKKCLAYGIKGFVLTNLVKSRDNKYLDPKDLEKIKDLKGNFSGLPVAENANKLISYVHKKYGKDCKIIGAGGVFTAEDAYLKIRLGASLVQMITGLIYNGPFVVRDINRGLVKLLENDGFKTVEDAVGTI